MSTVNTDSVPAQIPRKRVGKTELQASVLSLGSWHTYDRMDFSESVAMLREAVDRGVNLFDVGVYGFPGITEPVFTDVLFSAVVRAAGIHRDDYLLSAKLWMEGYPEFSLQSQLERALFRAGAQHADLVVLGDMHGTHPDLDSLVGDLAGLAQAGLIRGWGVNNWTSGDIQTLIDSAARQGVAGPQLAQLQYSVVYRSVADGEPFSRIFDQGVTMQSSNVFAGGALLGKDGGRQRASGEGDLKQRYADTAPEIARIAAELGATSSQLCIAFTLTHPSNTTTLFGATSLDQFRENLGAVDLVERVGAAALRELVAPLWIVGEADNPAS